MVTKQVVDETKVVNDYELGVVLGNAFNYALLYPFRGRSCHHIIRTEETGNVIALFKAIRYNLLR